MTTPSFSLRIDSLRSVLYIVVSGVWDLPTFKAFEREYTQALRSEGAGSITVSDLRDFPIQSPEIQTAIEKLSQTAYQNQARTSIVIASEAIVAMQMKRITRGSAEYGQVRFVTSPEEAEELVASQWQAIASP